MRIAGIRQGLSRGAPSVIVIDASMALAWLFERQQTIDIDRANRLLVVDSWVVAPGDGSCPGGG